MTILAATKAALKGLPNDWRAQVALALASSLDETPNASVARELRAVMDAIAEAADPKEQTSVADELKKRRQTRIANTKAV